MSIHVKDTELTFVWGILPTGAPPVKSDFDILLVLPNGVGTYTDDGVLTYVAPTSTTQGIVTYKYTPTTLGRYQVSLTVGGSTDYVIKSERELFIVDGTFPWAAVGGDTYRGPLVTPPDYTSNDPAGSLRLQVTQALGTPPGGNMYWGFTLASSSWGPMGSIDTPTWNGYTIAYAVMFYSTTAGPGFWMGVSGNHIGLGNDFWFDGVTPEGSVRLTPADISSFSYDSGNDITSFLWHESQNPTLDRDEVIWDGASVSEVLLEPALV
jgi:hypothetical protein